MAPRRPLAVVTRWALLAATAAAITRTADACGLTVSDATAFRSRFVGSGRPGFDDRGRSARAAVPSPSSTVGPRPSSTVLALLPCGAALLLDGAVLLLSGTVLSDGIFIRIDRISFN